MRTSERIYRFVTPAVVAAVIIATTLLGDALAAEDKPRRVSSSDARAAVKALEEAFARDDFEIPSLKTIHRVRALREIGEIDHANVVKKLKTMLDEKDPKVWAATVAALGKMKQNARKAAPILEKLYDPGHKDVDRTIAIVSALGDLRYKKMSRPFVKLFSHDSDKVTIAAIRALGAMGDRSILKEFGEFYKMNELDPSKGVYIEDRSGNDVAVETARARAEAERLQKLRRFASRNTVLEETGKALTELCGTKITSSTELRTWMSNNRALW